MAISFAEPIDIQCPNCGTLFGTDTWLIVDGHERPDLLAHILEGTLHDAVCPQCATGGEVPAPLLYHDGQAQRVLLAVPPDMSEDEWRAAGQTLLWTLIGALPESRRQPYLGELQAEAGLAGIAQVLRAEGLAQPDQHEDTESLPPIVSAIQAVLGARGPAELQNAFQRHPILLDTQAIAILRELAHEAFKQGESEAGSGFTRAADILNEFRSANPDFLLRAPATTSPEQPRAMPAEDPLDELAFALLRSHSGDMLAATINEHPELLEPGMDDALAAWAERARADGKPRVADGLDQRREVLLEMRRQAETDAPLVEAIQALLEADNSEELDHVLLEYDTLFTDAADTLLTRLVEGADLELVTLIRDRQTLLRRVRQALNAQENADQADQGTLLL